MGFSKSLLGSQRTLMASNGPQWVKIGLHKWTWFFFCVHVSVNCNHFLVQTAFSSIVLASNQRQLDSRCVFTVFLRFFVGRRPRTIASSRLASPNRHSNWVLNTRRSFWGGTLVIGRGFFFFFFLFFLFEFCGLNDCCDGITRMPLSGYEAFWGESIRCNKTEAYFHTRHSLIGCRWIDGGLWMIWRRKKTTLLPKMEAAARNRFTSAISCRFEVTIALIFPATPQNWNEPIKSEITLLRLRRASKEDVFPEIR